VRLKGTGACSATITGGVTTAIAASQLPVATVSDKTGCTSQPVALSATLGAGTTTEMTYTWDIGGTISTTYANSTTSQTLTAATTYTVQLTNAYGCVGAVSAPAAITVSPLPVASVSSERGCSGQTVALSASPSGGTTTAMTYTWNIGGTTSTTNVNSTTSQVLTASVDYTVQLTNAYGCVGRVSSSARITVYPMPGNIGDYSYCGCASGLINCDGNKCRVPEELISWTACSGITAVMNGCATVPWSTADAYCKGKGMRLPTRAEGMCICTNYASLPASFSSTYYWTSTPGETANRYYTITLQWCNEIQWGSNTSEYIMCVKN
jgi:hypothetical protein